MIHSTKIKDVTARPELRGQCFTGIEEIAAIAGAAASVGSIGMSIIGSGQQADAQRQAGDIAYRNALARQQALEVQAQQEEAQAKQEQAIAQRNALEQKRRATIAAGRATAVMAASGAGVDNRLVEGILGEGDYGYNTALYQGEDRAQKLNYQASLDRYAGRTGVDSASATRSAYYNRADSTETTGYGKALFSGLSLASKYAPDFGGSSVSDTLPGSDLRYSDALAQGMIPV